MILLAAKTAIKEPKRSSALVRRETFASYCFLLPSLIFFLGFVIYPMVLCVVTSFFDSTMNRADIFVGLANYKELFHRPHLSGCLKEHLHHRGGVGARHLRLLAVGLLCHR